MPFSIISDSRAFTRAAISSSDAGNVPATGAGDPAEDPAGDVLLMVVLSFFG
jgi:hypothetical protein